MAVQNSLEASDGRFAYNDWGGKGPLAHFAHATGFCAGAYSPLAEILASRLRLFGMDYRGHGKTTVPADPATLKDWDLFANDLGCFLSHLKRPVVAIGHSLGAVTSMMLAARRPELFQALILIDPTIMPQYMNLILFGAQKLGMTRVFPIISNAARRTRIWPSKQTLLDAYRNRRPFKNWSTGFLNAYIQHGFQDLPNGQTAIRCEPEWESKCFATCPAGVWEYPRLLKTPVLIIYGQNSDVFLQTCANKFQREVPNVTLNRIKGASHFVPMEKPHDTANSVFEFLTGLKIIP